MKRNLLGLFAVVLAITVSSFTVKVDTNFYYQYLSGDQTQKSNYSQVTSQPAHQVGGGRLNWLRVVDQNDGVVSQAEFLTQFNIFDTDNDNTLNDQADISGQLDVKTNL